MLHTAETASCLDTKQAVLSSEHAVAGGGSRRAAFPLGMISVFAVTAAVGRRRQPPADALPPAPAAPAAVFVVPVYSAAGERVASPRPLQTRPFSVSQSSLFMRAVGGAAAAAVAATGQRVGRAGADWTRRNGDRRGRQYRRPRSHRGAAAGQTATACRPVAAATSVDRTDPWATGPTCRLGRAGHSDVLICGL